MDTQTQTKTVLSWSSPKPKWATIMFRTFASLSTAAAFVIASDPRIQPETKVWIGVYLKAADMVVLGISNAFGVETTEVPKEDGKEN